MNKITKFLIYTIIILLIICVFLNGYVNKTENIANKIGPKVGGGELTVKEYYTLSQCIETYKNLIEKKDYESAYKMLGSSYKNYISYEDYEKNTNFDKIINMNIVDIDIVTSTTFDVLTDTSGEKSHYSIILNENKFSLYPESFLDYKQLDLKESKKKLVCILKDCKINTDKTILAFELTNKDKNDKINISNAILNLTENKKISQEQDIEILPGETKNITIEFETDYEFSEKVTLQKNGKNGKLVEYSFDLN